jgi:hypothetical protein
VATADPKVVAVVKPVVIAPIAKSATEAKAVVKPKIVAPIAAKLVFNPKKLTKLVVKPEKVAETKPVVKPIIEAKVDEPLRKMKLKLWLTLQVTCLVNLKIA